MGQAGYSGGEQGATAQAQSLSAKGRKEDPETAGFPVQAVIISSSSEISQDLARINNEQPTGRANPNDTVLAETPVKL